MLCMVSGDMSKAVVKVTYDNFPNIHQFIDVISVDLVPKFGDENRERVLSITLVPASSVLPIDSEGSSRQQLYQPLSNIREHPAPPEPPDKVVILASSLNLSLLVTAAKQFSICLECHHQHDMHRMPTTPGDFEDKHMLCAARLLEMLNLYAINHENCAQSDSINKFIIEEIKVLNEVKWIGLPNFMPQAAFLSLLQRKLQVSTQRACEKLIAKQHNSIQYVMEAIECGKAKVTEPLLDGLCIKVPKVLAPPEPPLANTCNYCSDIFYDGSSSVFANIHCYFDDSAGVRIFDFVSKAGGIKHFVHRRMRKPIGYVCSLIVKETFNKFLSHWMMGLKSMMKLEFQDVYIGSYLNALFYDDYSYSLEDHHCYFDHRACLIDAVIFAFKMMVRTYGFMLMMVMSYGVTEDLWEKANLDNGKSLNHVYNSLAWKLCVAPLYVSYCHLTKDFLLIFQHTKLVIVLHRKMIFKGSFHAPKVLTKLKDWLPKHGYRKFVVNVDLVEAILQRKMIQRGSVHVSLVLLKWKTLPPKHGTWKFSSLRTRMFEGESIVTGINY
ncbi:dynamin-related protein 4c-like [Trifolium pratense]|uniref:Dynamin-related protein 4c-like n=1 Tax=Trifolium pratense TaxID=57577 RepID=A0A2K3MUR9_TRIPR|nr:dynamin-related protein 4c-like [Trifolium pratense]